MNDATPAARPKKVVRGRPWRIEGTPELTPESIRDNLLYEPSTGYFTWVNSPFKGRRAGYLNSQGYRRIELLRRGYQAHQLVWFYVHGELPATELDHLNGQRDDNRIENLRLADRFINMQNTGIRRTSLSGFAGVSFYKPAGKWRAQIRASNVTMNLGLYGSPEEAHAAYIAAKIKYHAGFARHTHAPETMTAKRTTP